MRYKILNILIFILIISCSNIYSSNNDEKILLVNTDTLILREKPTRDSTIITKLFKNRLLIILEETNINEKINNIDSKWYKIKTLNNKIGYVFGGYLKEPVKLNSVNNSSNNSNKNNEPYEKVEARKIAQYSFIKRTGKDLIIKLVNGKQKTISDFIPVSPNDEIKTTKHYFYDYLNEINYIIIENSYYESWEYALVNLQNGEDIEIYSNNIITSPDKKKLLILTEFHKILSGGGINIIDISSGKPLMIYEKRFDTIQYYPVKGIWTSSNIIKIECKFKTNKISFLFDVLLKYENNNWIIEE